MEAQHPEHTAASADEVTSPGKALRVGIMAKHLLDELRDTSFDDGGLDDAGRTRLREAHDRTLDELSEALSPSLRAELTSLTEPFDEEAAPSSSELRMAHAQLVGWLEGLFQGVRATAAAHQLTALQQLDESRQLPQPAANVPAGGTYL